MIQRRFRLLAILLMGVLSKYGNSVDFIDFLKERFTKDFHDRCDKYQFVQEYYKKLENPGDRYTVFIYQEHGFRNGGLGDRLGGLISAVAIALRFNRTLLIRSSNGFDELYHPFHPDNDPQYPKYNYKDVTTWTSYNKTLEAYDKYTWDFWGCINNPGGRNRQCGMFDGDDYHNYPNVLYRSNRAYLCSYDIYDFGSQWQMKMLGVNTSTSDLFEVGGCMLRLVMWPSEKLWNEIAKIYKQYEHRYYDSGLRKLDKEKEKELTHSGASTDMDVAAGGEWHSGRSTPDPYFQVGLHFRCGDKSYIHKEGDSCIWTEAQANADKQFMNTGNPVGIGQCARKVMDAYTEKAYRLSSVTTATGPSPITAVSERDDESSAAPATSAAAPPTSSVPASQQQQQQQHGSTTVYDVRSSTYNECASYFTASSWSSMKFSDFCHLDQSEKEKTVLKFTSLHSSVYATITECCTKIENEAKGEIVSDGSTSDSSTSSLSSVINTSPTTPEECSSYFKGINAWDIDSADDSMELVDYCSLKQSEKEELILHFTSNEVHDILAACCAKIGEIVSGKRATTTTTTATAAARRQRRYLRGTNSISSSSSSNNSNSTLITASSTVNKSAQQKQYRRRASVEDWNSYSTDERIELKNFVKEFVYISSDNQMSAKQMNETLGHPHSLLAPNGCHIELDETAECHAFTVANWMVLAFSDAIVHQEMVDVYGAPTSSYSRYAGIYGLRKDPFRGSQHCDDIQSTFKLSRKRQSNWQC